VKMSVPARIRVALSLMLVLPGKSVLCAL